MKKIIYLLLILISIGFISCQEKVDIVAEKEAIMKVIQNESEFARDGKYDEFLTLYVQDEYNTRLNYGLEGYEIITGWNNIASNLEFIKEREEDDLNTFKISKENAIVKITGKTAWLICDNIWKGVYEGEEEIYENIQLTFLEKVDGTWKISFTAWIAKPEPEENIAEKE